MEGEPDERPAHKVDVDAFCIDRYLVTNADYARFLNVFGNRVEGGKKWLDNVGPLSSWLCKIQKKDDRFVPKPGYENHPVIKVSWYGARAYARWLGKRLPTEAEWEKAVRGGFEGKKYVYGDTLSPFQANVGGFHATTPVGSYPPMGLDCTTWWPVSGSGVMTGTIRIIMPDHLPGIRKDQRAVR